MADQEEGTTKIKAFMNHHFPFNEKMKLDELYYHIQDGHIIGKEDIEHDQEIEITIKEI